MGRFPDWPGQPENFANVLCEGPSILALRPADLLPGPVVAVNHTLALDGLRGLQVDLWATSDHPEKLREWSLRFRRPGLRYWTTDPNVAFWSNQGEIVSQGLLYSVDETVMAEDGGHLTVLPTIIPLLGWLARVGCRHIRILGSDMRGAGSPIGHEPWEEESTSAWKWRWGVERVLLAHAFRRLRSEGVRVERWRPLCRPTPSPFVPTSS